MDLNKAVENFKANGYEVSVFDTAVEAASYLDKEIDGKTVGFGGSVTLRDMGIYPMLEKHNEVYWHWMTPDGVTVKEMLHKAALTDVYLSSINGASETGEIINIDGNGNRVASTLYGHDKVYFVMGTNKLAPDLQGAIDRARNIASPLNCQRLELKNPCIKDEKCHDCKSPQRACNAMVIHYKKMTPCDMEIVIIKENLGY